METEGTDVDKIEEQVRHLSDYEPDSTSMYTNRQSFIIFIFITCLFHTWGIHARVGVIVCVMFINMESPISLCSGEILTSYGPANCSA